MSILSQVKYFRKRLVKYSEEHSITDTAIRYKVSRKTVYKWRNRYDGSLETVPMTVEAVDNGIIFDFAARLQHYPNHFWVLADGSAMVGFINEGVSKSTHGNVRWYHRNTIFCVSQKRINRKSEGRGNDIRKRIAEHTICSTAFCHRIHGRRCDSVL